jgi:hypothetical protein
MSVPLRQVVAHKCASTKSATFVISAGGREMARSASGCSMICLNTGGWFCAKLAQNYLIYFDIETALSATDTPAP